MKLSIWNIYNRLSYPDRIPMVKEGNATIVSLRWIVSADLNPDYVYIGKEGDFFADSADNTIIVHRKDMILVRGAEPEEVYNEVSSIMEFYQEWDHALDECKESTNALTEMISKSKEILKNPSFIYAPDGEALAISPDFPAQTHWHWAEIIENHGLSEERMSYFQEAIDLTNVFLDRTPTRRRAALGDYEYIHCSLIANGYMAGHFVLLSMVCPFENGLEYLVENLTDHMQDHMNRHKEDYSPNSKISRILSAMTHGRPYSEKDFALFQNILGWNGRQDIFRIYMIRENSDGEPVLTAKISSKIAREYRSCVSFIEGKLLVLVVNITLQIREKEDYSAILNSLKTGFSVGVSNPFCSTDKVRRYYRQALCELSRCKDFSAAVSYAGDHTSDYIREAILRDDLNETYVKRNLLSLRDKDKIDGTKYYETLKAWFYSGFHPSDAASMLKIHRNSFNYRMERIRELIDFDEIDGLVQSRDTEKINEYFYSFIFIDNSSD